MRATRFLAACLPVFVLTVVSVAGCDDAEDAKHPSKPGCVDCSASGGAGSFGGQVFSGSGSSSPPNGGAIAAPSSAGTPGDRGEYSRGGQGGAGTAGAAGGEAGAMADTRGEQLQLCVRLPQGANNADTVASKYVGAIYRDCRVDWLVPLGQDLARLLNQLVSFSYNLWGCEKTAPVTQFGLVLGTPALSQGDVNVLIDHYLEVAQGTLDLSPLERQTLQAALVRLSKPLIVDPSLEPSKSACAASMGGAGGSAGAGGAL